MEVDAEEIDESLYNRQLYVMGREGQARMAASNILISGLNGLGVEIAKNVILAGVKSVTLLDSTSVSWMDLSAQFYLTDKDLGRTRAAASLPKLAELNPYVRVSLLEDENLSAALLSRLDVQCVVMVNAPLDLQLSINDYCHTHGLQFITAEAAGVFGNLFCDFGNSFVVSDTNGENPSSCIVASITQASQATVTVLDDSRHGLETGDTVRFSGLTGMEELNDRDFVVTVKDGYSFDIDMDTSTIGPYRTGGYVNQVKQPATVQF